MVCKYNNDILKKRKKTEINYKKMIVHVHTKGFTTTFSAYFIVFLQKSYHWRFAKSVLHFLLVDTSVCGV